MNQTSQLTTLRLTVLQVLPALSSGGVERGTLEVGQHLARLGHRSLVLSAGGRLVSQLTAQGSQHIELPIGKKSIFTFLLVPQLIRLFKAEAIDVIHVRSRMPAWVIKCALWFMPKAIRPALVSTVHGQYSVNGYSAVMTQADAVIVVSAHIQDYVSQHYPKATQPVVLNYRGVDPHQFPYDYQPTAVWLSAWYERYPQLREKFIITLPARITRWKGHEDLCKLMAILKSTIPNAHALVVGEVKQGKEAFLTELETMIEALALSEQITFTGHRSDMREIMAISDVVLSLSHTPEAFGRVSIEALTMGVPVIAYDHGGVGEQLAEVFPEGRVKPKNYKAVARLIEQWYQDKPTVKPTTAFGLQQMLETTVNVYQAVDQGKKAPR